MRGFCGRAGRGGTRRFVRQVFRLRLFAEQATMTAWSWIRSADWESSISLFRPCFLSMIPYAQAAEIFPHTAENPGGTAASDFTKHSISGRGPSERGKKRPNFGLDKRSREGQIWSNITTILGFFSVWGRHNAPVKRFTRGSTTTRIGHRIYSFPDIPPERSNAALPPAMREAQNKSS